MTKVGSTGRCTGCILEDQLDKRIHCAKDNYRQAEATRGCESADTFAHRLKNRQRTRRRMAKIQNRFKRVKKKNLKKAGFLQNQAKNKLFTEFQVIGAGRDTAEQERYFKKILQGLPGMHLQSAISQQEWGSQVFLLVTKTTNAIQD